VIHAALVGSEFVLIQGAGHFPFIEQGEATLGAVREFLETAGRRGQSPDATAVAVSEDR
jgi:hypothetical protein